MIPALKLSSGYSIPCVGLGTWLSKPNQVGSAVKFALKAGYKHIDCAYVYRNQGEIGVALSEAFREDLIKREDVFVTSKVWNTYHSYDLARKNVDLILEQLRLDYLDLCLMHWPQAYAEGGDLSPQSGHGEKMKYSLVDYLETWRAMEDCVDAGKVRSIGTSNFNHRQLKRVIDNCTIKPSVLQVELHPYLSQPKLRHWCTDNGIVVTAYSPLANSTMPYRKPDDPFPLEDPVIKNIASAHRKTPAQIILRWAIQHGAAVIPKSVTQKRIFENISLFDLRLSGEEMLAIDGLNRNMRLCDSKFRDGDHPYYPFNEDF